MKKKIVSAMIIFTIVFSFAGYIPLYAQDEELDDTINETVDNNQEIEEIETDNKEIQSEEVEDEQTSTKEQELISQEESVSYAPMVSRINERNESEIIQDITNIITAIYDKDKLDPTKEPVVSDMIDKFYQKTSVDTSLTWFDTSSLGLTPWDGTFAELVDIPRSSNGSYLVSNGPELARAILSTPDTTTTVIELVNDIDLNGKEQYWISGYGSQIALNSGQTLDGKGHTIYNLCTQATKSGYSSRSGFLTSIDGKTVIKNLNFQNALMLGSTGDPGAKGGCGMIGWIAGGTVQNVHMKDCIGIGYGQTAAICGRAVGSSSKPVSIENVSAQDCVMFGRDHIGSLTGPLVNVNSISKGWSLGCSVYSTGSHSGGLISCIGSSNIDNCFIDVHIYGSQDTGVFTGAANGPTTITNCASSGFIEGDSGIGGFIGTVEGLNSNMQISNCYTTALVGLDPGGKEKGGFVGRLGTSSLPSVNFSFTNCYAAGEVGYLDVDTSGDGTGTQEKSDGGFVGADLSALNTSLNRSFTNCYYDKQTTAMKEWAVGKKNNLVDISGIKGVLTTDTIKSGTGLISEPGTSGFVGFTSDSNLDTSEVGHYPEIKTFKDASNWDGYEEIVKNFSLSSTSTLFLDAWDYGLNTSTGKLDKPMPESVYGTVRDLTSGFNLTSTKVAKWERMATADNDTAANATTIINDKTYNILDLKYQNGVYLCDELVPGIEWLRVSEGEDELETHRRVRVIPTASINAGESVIVTDKYDHSDDVEVFFSTALRLGAEMNDISTGIYPDSSSVGGSNPITEEQIKLMSNLNNQTIKTNEGDINSFFDGNDNDKYKDVDMSYMSKGSDNAEGSKLYTYIYTIDSIADNGEIIYNQTPLDLSDGSELATMFNGYSTFKNQNQRFLVTYMWQLADGRVLQDAKLVRRAEVPFSLSLNVYNNTEDNLYTNGAKVYTGNVVGVAQISNDLKDSATSLSKFQYDEPSEAGWKLKNEEDTIKSIKVTIEISETEKYSTEITNLVPGEEVQTKIIYYRVVYKNNTYFTIPEPVYLCYKFQYDEATKIYYFSVVDMIGKDDKGNIVQEIPGMQSNIRVDVVVNHDSSKDPIDVPDPDDSINPIDTHETKSELIKDKVNTNDTSNRSEYIVLSLISLSIMLLTVKRKKEN